MHSSIAALRTTELTASGRPPTLSKHALTRSVDTIERDRVQALVASQQRLHLADLLAL